MRQNTSIRRIARSRVSARPLARLACLSACALAASCSAAPAGDAGDEARYGQATAALTTYQVGPGKQYANLQAVASLLKPGDVVEVMGGATYPGGLRFTSGGTASAKITIRGVPVNGARPVLSGGTNTVEFAANHYVFENFDVTAGSTRCVFHHADDITIRGTVIHNCPTHGLLGADSGSGSLLLEASEVHHCGSGDTHHQIYMATDETAYPGSVFRMQHCYVHDGLGGNNVKSRAERNEIYYNWIEGAYYRELELIGPDGQAESLAREDSDVVGNVLYQGYTDRSHPAIRAGGDGTGQTWGRYRFVNNTIVVGNATTSAVFQLFDGIESIEMHDNVLFRLGGGPVTVYTDADATWKAGQVIGGMKNWVTTGSASIPSTWSATLTGASPGFVDTAGKNVHLTSGCALVDAGVTAPPSPSGHPFPNPLVTPAYEPPLHTVLATPVARNIVSAIDLGAYELAGGTSSPPPPAPTTTSTSPAPTTTAPPSPPPTTTAPPPPPPAGSGTTTTLATLADAYVQLSDPSSNFGSASVLFSATNATAWYNDDAYVKFDIGGLSRVTSAKLRVRAALTSTSEGALTMAVYPVTDASWSESAITWSNKPARDSSPLASTSVTTDSYVVYELDVTSYVAAQKAAGQGVVSFALHDPSATNARVLMQSKESGGGPVLVVAQ